MHKRPRASSLGGKISLSVLYRDMQFLPGKVGSSTARALATVVGLPLATGAFCFWTQNDDSPACVGAPLASCTRFTSSRDSVHHHSLLKFPATRPSSTLLASSASKEETNLRTRQTPVDEYFQKHGSFEGPKVPHMILPRREESSAGDDGSKNILVIGDVHGCFEEMLKLHAKAVSENDDKPFEYIILVGDMCNKGPESAKVVRWVRTQPSWYSVRGNHDESALRAALGDHEKLKKPKYSWVLADNSSDKTKAFLSDEDVLWMSELPYTITIPGSYLGEDVNTLIVHAGLIPNKALEEQKVKTMITVRTIIPFRQKSNSETSGGAGTDDYIAGGKLKPKDYSHNDQTPVAWASAWKGPQRVIFGHDARRGLQQHEWALGLDTGAVYGNGMTAVILPERKIVSIKTKTHQAVDRD